MKSLRATHRTERKKWNALARRKASTPGPLTAYENFQEYARHTATTVGVNEFLGDLRDRHVLEYGCGLGAIAVLLARSGARVTSFDLSPESVATTRRHAASHGVADRIALTVAAGEHLPYADERFDVIVGKAILHHLAVQRGWPELYRVLKTGGKAVFVEPMGMNPLLRFAREYVPYPHKNPRGADRPLHYDEIHAWGRCFRTFRYREIQLLSMLERGLGFRKRLSVLRRLDNLLLRRLPFLRRYCRYVVMYMVK